MAFALPRNHGARLMTGVSFNGIAAVILENELVRMTVLSGKGGDVFEFLHKPSDTDFMWRNPLGLPRADRLVNGNDRLKSFFDFYFGGWQELFPHGSAPEENLGQQNYFHGELTLSPMDVTVVEDTPKRVAVKLSTRLRLSPFTVEKTFTLAAGSGAVEIHERIENFGKVAVRAMWGHHPAFGEPFLTPETRLFAPVEAFRHNEGPEQTDWPNLRHADGRVEDLSRLPDFRRDTNDMVYPSKLSAGWYALIDPKKQVGFGMVWDPKLFPYLWIWRNFTRKGGWPWYGGARALAVEPFSSFPRAVSKGGRMITVGPGKTLETRLLALAISGVKRVKNISRQGKITRG
ncbi:MAG: DUF4432 family protein [Planctomycetota bacterium]